MESLFDCSSPLKEKKNVGYVIFNSLHLTHTLQLSRLLSKTPCLIFLKGKIFKKKIVRDIRNVKQVCM